jgi:hypothetical protein
MDFVESWNHLNSMQPFSVAQLSIQEVAIDIEPPPPLPHF